MRVSASPLRSGVWSGRVGGGGEGEWGGGGEGEKEGDGEVREGRGEEKGKRRK